MNKEELVKLILAPLGVKDSVSQEQEVSKEQSVVKKINASLAFELKAYKHYYSITNITNFYVGSMFELDFDQLGLFFENKMVTNIENFKLKVI